MAAGCSRATGYACGRLRDQRRGVADESTEQEVPQEAGLCRYRFRKPVAGGWLKSRKRLGRCRSVLHCLSPGGVKEEDLAMRLGRTAMYNRRRLRKQ
ncbi:hypothetical protein HPP92_025357 [Vanilla planifolia]|uniref:Uncharacterized protein n=1 Tax=Vanilla planifolia TaxID=51239 RepID=A0A835U7Y9_VANPL|nr:hypothetical protein HPP92_025658 [Vanilla planifolia]KAG0454053.1 hypothetical protein HPP92_025357 [Vanilla planifolia]